MLNKTKTKPVEEDNTSRMTETVPKPLARSTSCRLRNGRPLEQSFGSLTSKVEISNTKRLVNDALNRSDSVTRKPMLKRNHSLKF